MLKKIHFLLVFLLFLTHPLLCMQRKPQNLVTQGEGVKHGSFKNTKPEKKQTPPDPLCYDELCCPCIITITGAFAFFGLLCCIPEGNEQLYEYVNATNISDIL